MTRQDLPAPAAIPRERDEAAGPDFHALKAEGIALLQRYAGAAWTDYNEHDPGVTILEQICFALTEIGYRTGFPVEDLLAGHGTPFRRPAQILSSEPVTAADYRRLLIDRVAGLGNAWLTPATQGGGGLYAIALYPAPDLPGRLDPAPDPEALTARARRLYLRNRALCEDIATIAVLRPVRTIVGARVAIDRAGHPEAIMADILYRLGAFLAPEPRRSSLAALAETGLRAPDLIEGPALANGLIAQEALGPQRTGASAADLSRLVSAAAGVLAVEALDIRLGGPDAPGRHSATIGPGHCFALDGGLEASVPPIALIVDGHRQEVDRWEVQRLLKRRWADHRRTWRSAGEAARAFAPPEGRPRDVASYEPLSAHLPGIYGVGEQGLGSDAPPRRRAQARQLLGFLALFDRLMVDHLDRLAALPLLVSGAPIDPGALARPLAAAIPSLAPLLVDGGPDSDSLLGRAAVPPGQRGRLLDWLLALYGEAPGDLIPRGSGRRRAAEAPALERSVKRALLRDIVAAGRRRGRGFNYEGKTSPRNRSGVELRSRLMLGAGLEPVKRRRPRLAIVEHVLLRPRGGEGAGRDPSRALSVSAIVHAGPDLLADGAWRRQVVRMIRANTPAHILLEAHFVDRPAWIRFKRLHRLWRGTLRNRLVEATDRLSRDLARMLGEWPQEEDHD
jgi:hypothetical protein